MQKCVEFVVADDLMEMAEWGGVDRRWMAKKAYRAYNQTLCTFCINVLL